MVDGSFTKAIRKIILEAEKMVDEDRYCMDVLTLSLAIQRAMKEMDHLIMEEHMNSCVQEGVRSGKSKEVTKELMDLFEVIRK